MGDYDGMRVITHGGGQPGTSTFLALLPDTGTAVAVMCNLQRVPIGNIAEKIFVVLRPLPEEPAGNESQPPGGWWVSLNSFRSEGLPYPKSPIVLQ